MKIDFGNGSVGGPLKNGFLTSELWGGLGAILAFNTAILSGQIPIAEEMKEFVPIAIIMGNSAGIVFIIKRGFVKAAQIMYGAKPEQKEAPPAVPAGQ